MFIKVPLERWESCKTPPRRSLLTHRWHERFTSFSATLAGLVGGWNRFQGVLAWGGECPAKSGKKRSWKSGRKKSRTATITNNKQQTTNNQPTVVLRAFLGHSFECGSKVYSDKSFVQRSKRSTRKTEGASAPADTLHQLPHQHHDLIIFLGKHWDRYKSHQSGVTLKALCSNLDRKAPTVEKVLGKIIAYRGKTTWLSQWRTFELLGFWGSLAFYALKYSLNI